jgi:hypothetical protein
MLDYTESNFVNTIQSQNNLNFRKSWRAILTVLLFFVITIFLVILSIISDLSDKLKLDGSMNVVGSRKVKKMQSLDQYKSVEKSLPTVFQNRSLLSKVIDEIKLHHKWIAIKFHYTSQFPRPLRVICLASNLIVLLFVQSITYNIGNPDDGSCEKLFTESSCLKPRSPLGSGPKCSWTNDHCLPSVADNNFTVILFVAILSAVVGSPIALFINWLVQNFLCDLNEKATFQDSRLISNKSTKKNYSKSEFFSLAQINLLSECVRNYRVSLLIGLRKEFDSKFLQISIIIYIYLLFLISCMGS